MRLLAKRAKEYLDQLCNQIPNRRVGSEGNRLATVFFAETLKSAGFDVECHGFDCMDWQSQGATLTVAGGPYDIRVSPYSPGTQVKALLVSACSATELENMDLANNILLMHGELTREQFMPKNFLFFQVEEQQRIIQLLEAKKPRAVITATTRNPEMAGALYPFPVFEDGDFDIPSVFMTEEQGLLLAKQAGTGREVTLEIHAERIPARAWNVVAHKGDRSAERIVLFAHIDAKVGTPGALDNGTGIITLLLLADLLKEYRGKKCIEIVALNGEDYYSSPGEQLYLSQNEGKFQEILLGINIDGLGYVRGKTAYTLYGCPAEITGIIEQIFSNDRSFIQGEPWFQGDHAIFLMNGRPALALTSELVPELMAEFVHTAKDTPEIIDTEKTASAALALQQLLMSL